MIYMVRHGEAAAGWGDHPDPGLSDKGHAQASAVANQLGSLGIAQAISSPMQRCQETSTPFITQSKLPLTTEPAVSEIPTPPVINDRVTWLRTLMTGAWDEAPGLVQDWRSALIQTVSTLPQKTVVFSHFIAINAIVGHLEGSKDVTLFRPDHCSITTLDKVGSGLRLVSRGQEASTKVL